MKRMIYTLCALLLLCSTFLFVSCNDDKSSTTSTPSMPTHVCSGEWSTYEATCTREGSRSRTCTSCGKYETEIIAMLEHAYTEDNFCEQCHVMKEGTYTKGLEYEKCWFYGGKDLFGLSETTSFYGYQVIGVGEAANQEEIIIPSYYEGLKVGGIATRAFLGCNKTKNIIIPRTVITIREEAFYGCSSLESMTIPTIGYDCSSYSTDISNIYGGNTLALFGYYFGKQEYPGSECVYQRTCYGRGKNNNGVYKDFYSGSSFYIPASLKTIILTGSSEDESLEPYAFINTNIETLIIKATVKGLGSNAFNNCDNLKNIIFEENSVLTYVDGFEGCDSLTVVEIPYSVKSVSGFQGCANLTTVILPDSVEIINMKCFAECVNLKNINLPASLKEIEGGTSSSSDKIWGAFYNCSSLVEITLPKSLKMIDYGAFWGCTNLKTIYNNSALYITAGSTSNGHVSYYAETIISK